MKVRNYYIQVLYRKIGKIHLKFAECLAGFFYNGRIIGYIESNRIVDKSCATPETVLFVHEIILPVFGGLVMQNVAFRAYARSLNLFPDILGNFDDIFHYGFRIFENVHVDTL